MGSGGATDNDGASMKPLVAQKEASVEENVEEKPSLPTSAAPVHLSGKAKEQILYDATKKEVVAEQKIEATKEKIDTRVLGRYWANGQRQYRGQDTCCNR